MQANGQNRIIASVTNDLVTDNRVHKVCASLSKFGFEVLLVGRRFPGSVPLDRRGYGTRRMKLFFQKGPFFYAEYNLRLFFFLLFSKADIFLSNDLDTLPANYLASKLRRKILVFDSHEYFTEVPELINRPRIQRIWKSFERLIVPKLKYAYTVCDSIAGLYYEEYGVRFSVVRNIPERQGIIGIPKEKKIETAKKIVLYQGAVNIGRGLEQAISAMQYIDEVLLVIVGTGDIIEDLKGQVAKMKLGEKVLFAGRLPVAEVKYYTMQADLGLSIEEDMGLNYRFALTNKFFDYIAAGVPVLVSDLPEMAKLVNHYNIGKIIYSHEPQEVAEDIKVVLGNEGLRKIWKINLEKAASELTWQNEEKVLQRIFMDLAG